MNIEKFNNKIIIINDSAKKDLLEKINSYKQLINVKIITLSELKKKYYFDYTKETINYVSKKYNCIPNIAKIYIDNLYYIVERINEEKLLFLYDLKNELKDNKLIIENKLFKEFLKNKDIILFNLKYVDKFYINIFNELKKYSNVEEYNETGDASIKKIYEAKNMNEEITFVASKICELINDGIDINDIKLANIKENYIFNIKKIFKLFNIPINLPSTSFISGTNIIKVFKENYNSDIKVTLEKVKEIIKTESDKKIYKQLVNTLNEYTFVKDYNDIKEQLYNDIDNIKINTNKLSNAVELIDIENTLLTDKYIFLMNFNEGVIPINNKDEDYLNDKLKDLLKISTTSDLNNKSNLNIQDKIKYLKNLIVTYRRYDNKEELFISSAYSEDLFEKEKAISNYNYSHAYNKLKLIALKDENNKYGTISEDLELLNSNYQIDYMSYDNKFKGIDTKELYDYLKQELSLSYSSVDNYYKCGFRYYLSNILKIDKYEDSFATHIGTIFHNVLEECFVDNYDLDTRYEQIINNEDYEFNNMERFFLDNLKSDLELTIKTIKEQLKYTQLHKTMYEKRIEIEINENLHIKFKGFVDKILYDEFNGKTVVAIIDYKTYSPTLNVKDIKFGLHMQLPIYAYLIKKSSEFKNVYIGGFYLQKILAKSNSEEEKINSLKLQGYSNSDLNILEKVDTSYENSKIIKSLKVKNDGSFSAYSKVLSDDEIKELYELVDSKIKEASEKIINGEFNINPKEYNGKNVGCEFCNYKDICYMKYKDIERLEDKEEE